MMKSGTTGWRRAGLAATPMWAVLSLFALLLALVAAGAAEGQESITIDPSASEAISIDSGEDTPVVTAPQTAVGKAIQNAIPETGNESIDQATGRLSKSLAELWNGFVAMVPQIIIGLIVLVLAVFLSSLAKKVARTLSEKAHLRPNLVDLFGILARILVLFLGLMVTASIIFPSFGVGQLVATAGLVSVAIGFAFQDIFENFFAGILILLNFPFKQGDFIQCDGVTAKVEDITVRMTKLRQTDGQLVLMPNSTLYKNNIVVMTNKPKRRLELAVGIAYGEDVAKGRSVILDAVKGCDTVDTSGDSPEVLAVNFGASSIDFDVIWWTKSSPIDGRRSKDQVVEAIKKALDDAGIEIPYPYRTLTFSKNEPDIIRAIAGGRSGEDGADAGGGENA